MAAISSLNIASHTTASSPHPHILYNVTGRWKGQTVATSKRYSEFVTLHEDLKDPFVLPPKRLLVTAFIPSAWVDDTLISERKVGLSEYLDNLSNSAPYNEDDRLSRFFGGISPPNKMDLEDSLPSTLTRKAALEAKERLLAEVAVDGGDAAASPIAAAYYPDWSSDTHPPEKIDFSKFDILFFAFATPNSSSTLSWTDDSSKSLLKRLVTSAKNSGKGTKVVLSVGGWGGSYWFSQAMSSSSNRDKFVNALASAVSTYALSGVDIDWEYPNSPGAGNPYSSKDAANLLSFLTTLRSKLGSSSIISSAVPHLPWIGSNGSPLKDVKAYAAQMTYVNIMNYDVWGASSSPGPNAPLSDLCGTSGQPQANAQAALAQWKAAGFPASKLLLGLPLYGYVSKSSKTVLSGNLMPSDDMLLLPQESEAKVSDGFLNGAHKRRMREVPNEKAAAGDLSAYWGSQVAFSTLLSAGALKIQNGNYVGTSGYHHVWDACSSTPYLHNQSRTTVVTYDDPQSLAEKAKFAKQQGMAGCFTWSLDQDSGVVLQNAIRSALGK